MKNYKKQIIELIAEQLYLLNHPINRFKINNYLIKVVKPAALDIALRSAKHDKDLLQSVVNGYVQYYKKEQK